MSESIKFPGSSSAQRKSDYLTNQADIVQAMRGDETFIRVTKGPGGLLISLNWQAVVERVPKTPPSQLRSYKVASLPAAVSGVVPPYVIAHSINANGSAGTSNTSVGVVQAHSVGDTFYALPVSGIYNSGSALMDSSNKSIGVMECGNYGMIFETACQQNGGSNGSAGTACAYTYDLYDPSNATKLASTLPAQRPRLFGMPTTAATKCYATISNAGAWVLLEVWESGPSGAC